MGRFAIAPRRLIDPAHLLSLSRVGLAGVVWARPDDAIFLFVVVAIAGITDVLDGLIGRRLHAGEADDIGSWLDPVCDKVFAVSVAIAVVVVWPTPWVVLPLLIVRDVLTAVLAAIFRLVDPLRFEAHDFHARPLGKVTTVLQTLTVFAVVAAPAWSIAAAWVTGVAGVLAVIDRIVVVLRQRAAR